MPDGKLVDDCFRIAVHLQLIEDAIPVRSVVVTGSPSSEWFPIWMDAGDDLHQGALARAVLTDDGDHLAEEKGGIHVVERVHPREAFVDSVASRKGFTSTLESPAVVGWPRQAYYD